jgi:hypothetical protein
LRATDSVETEWATDEIDNRVGINDQKTAMLSGNVENGKQDQYWFTGHLDGMHTSGAVQVRVDGQLV